MNGDPGPASTLVLDLHAHILLLPAARERQRDRGVRKL